MAKKYHEPLTQEILQRLHATKERSKQKVEQKAQAQAEAKERREKMRRKRLGIQDVIEETKRLRISAIQEKDHHKAIRRPYLLVEVGRRSFKRSSHYSIRELMSIPWTMTSGKG